MEHRLIRLLGRKLSGDASSEELEELESILNRHPELQFFYDEMIKPARLEEEEKELAEQSYLSDLMHMELRGLRLHSPASPARQERLKSPRLAYRIAIAALFILAAGLTFVTLRGKKQAVPTGNETATAKGSKSTVKLPDGTVVMLNTNSRLKYDENFKKDQREVTLEGEAYFDVAHDAEHPFIIHTNTADITVLGTVFNVRSFRDGYFETALIKGKVSIHLKDEAEGNFVLKPGQKLVAQHQEIKHRDKRGAENKSSTVKIDSITVVDSLVAETSWIKDRLVFADKPFIEIAKELEQVFNVTIVFKSDRTKQYRYNGVFSDADLNEILRILDLSKPIDYYRQKDSIFIR
ncbi:FecR family protein [Niabella drilacis]|nr:FecR domain-containing protein [Niabella drilacis]